MIRGRKIPLSVKPWNMAFGEAWIKGCQNYRLIGLHPQLWCVSITLLFVGTLLETSPSLWNFKDESQVSQSPSDPWTIYPVAQHSVNVRVCMGM